MAINRQRGSPALLYFSYPSTGDYPQLVQEGKPVTNNSHLLGINFLPVQFSEQGSMVGRNGPHGVRWDQLDTFSCYGGPYFQVFWIVHVSYLPVSSNTQGSCAPG